MFARKEPSSTDHRWQGLLRWAGTAYSQYHFREIVLLAFSPTALYNFNRASSCPHLIFTRLDSRELLSWRMEANCHFESAKIGQQIFSVKRYVLPFTKSMV